MTIWGSNRGSRRTTTTGSGTGGGYIDPGAGATADTLSLRQRPAITPDAEDLIGQIIYDYDTGEAWEVYRKSANRDKSGVLIGASYGLVQRDDAGRPVKQRKLTGTTWDTGAGSIFQMGENGMISTSRVLREGEQGVGTSARDYAGEAAQQHGYDVELERMKQAFQAEQARLDAERAMELQRLQEENAMKRARLGEAGSLARTAAEVQQRARQWIAENQGVDPIRAFIGGQGMAQRGQTPAQQFTGQLQGIASAPIPQVSENASIPEIEQTIQALQGQQQAPVQPSLGFALGGTVEAGAPTAHMGTTKRAILVGEEGGFTGDEEVVIIDSAQPGRTEVIPLMAGAAEGGMFDASTVFQTLAPIFKRLGLAGVGTKSPTGQGYALSPFGRQTTGGGNEVLGGSQYLSALGYRPNLIRDVSSGNTYYRGSDNQLHHLSPEAWNQAQFQIGDVLNVAPNELSQFGGFGAPQTAAPDMAEQPYQRYPQRSIPLSVPQPGGYDIPLFDPKMLAGIWRYLDPNTQHLMASFYGVAGLGGGPSVNPAQNALMQIQDIVKSMTPVGTGRTASAHF